MAGLGSAELLIIAGVCLAGVVLVIALIVAALVKYLRS